MAEVATTSGRPAANTGSDVNVQGTNDDAQTSKLSCVKLGYFKDNFIQYFVRRPSRRSPLINRGYYSRVAALRQLLQSFLAMGEGGASAMQILSLGAGFDTTFFQLAEEGHSILRYVEVDFPQVTRNKTHVIAATPQLHAHLSDSKPPAIDTSAGRIMSSNYCLLPADLRDLDALELALKSAGFDFDAPTFVLSECVLVYMEPDASKAVVQWLGERLTCAACVVYEQIKPDDAFGRQMLLNLECRGCPLKGLHATPTLEAHKARFLNNHWQRAMAADMDTIYQQHLDPADKRRIERLEIFDEFEEWHMIQEHYCITIGINDSQAIFNNFGFKTSAPKAASI